MEPVAATCRGPSLAVSSWARRLGALGQASVGDLEADPRGRATGSWRLRAPAGHDPVESTVTWHGPAHLPADRRATEATVQALSGLMAVHGWDAGRPRRVGIEVASVAAGVLAAQGTLAALIGASRGRPVARVHTSVLQAGLFAVSHHLAAATASDEPVIPPAGGPEPGPPFRTADGRWFEIEVFEAETWRDFWQALGAGGADLGRAWTSFRARYYRGRCSLPPGLHDVTASRTLAQAAAAAVATGVSLVPVRGYADVLVDPGATGGHPRLEPATFSVPSSSPGAADRTQNGDGAGDLPLAGLTVVEATSRMQGPLAGLLLQMLGADVVRVEPPGGDVGRMVPPLADGVGSFFLCFNRGKRAVEIDLRRPAGRAELLDLVASSDVFVENWRPGKAAEWGLAWDDVAARNAGLVYVHASGWGDRPEDERLIGTDFLIQAFAGFGDGLNPEGEPPLTSRALLTDFMGALVTAEGALAGLYRREGDGRGGVVGTSLLQGAMTAQAHVLDGLASGKEHGRRRGRPVWGALDRPLDTADGFLVVDVAGDDDFRTVCEACDVDAEDSSRAATEWAVAERLRSGEATGWEERLTAAGLACQVVSDDLASLAADPRLAPVFDAISTSCRAPATPWSFTW